MWPTRRGQTPHHQLAFVFADATSGKHAGHARLPTILRPRRPTHGSVREHHSRVVAARDRGRAGQDAHLRIPQRQGNPLRQGHQQRLAHAHHRRPRLHPALPQHQHHLQCQGLPQRPAHLLHRHPPLRPSHPLHLHHPQPPAHLQRQGLPQLPAHLAFRSPPPLRSTVTRFCDQPIRGTCIIRSALPNCSARAFRSAPPIRVYRTIGITVTTHFDPAICSTSFDNIVLRAAVPGVVPPTAAPTRDPPPTAAPTFDPPPPAVDPGPSNGPNTEERPSVVEDEATVVEEDSMEDGEDGVRVRTGLRGDYTARRNRIWVYERQWARCAAPTRRFGIYTSNMAESTNGAVKSIRRLPPAYLLASMWDYNVKKFHERRAEARARDDYFTE
ncbi:unnamed protein product [Closterium sp. Naga37s-1]|nr:unnamed protein product [Closterium sp. Naga37s-1]